MKAALLGPRGTYTHQAAEEYFENCEPVFCSNFREVLESDADAAIIPFENSLGGGVSEVIDLFREYGPTITGEQLLPIEHCLLSNTQIGDIEVVKSHPQALAQCRDIIEEHGWETVEASSTARAAEEIESGEAAIASELAGKLNELDVLQKGVQDSSSVTRFKILNGPKTVREKTSIILEPDEDRPGILYEMLENFSNQDINLTYIQSRPTKNKLGEYYFYVEAEAEPDTPEMQDALEKVGGYGKVKVLGSYKNGGNSV